MVVACYVSFAALGWFLNGFGSILPDLEDDIGRRASIYPLLPGAVMLVSGVFVVRRHRTVEPRSDYEKGIVAGSIALAVSLAVMGVTRWQWVSAIGALAAAIAAAYLVRLLPAVLATIRATDTERVMMRSNAYASVAAISAPLAVGASIALGAGWAPGMVDPADRRRRGGGRAWRARRRRTARARTTPSTPKAGSPRSPRGGASGRC